MNSDFTLQELEDIEYAIYSMLKADTSCDKTWREEQKILQGKVKCMISTYPKPCVHENI